jgi:hypothetical protein
LSPTESRSILASFAKHAFPLGLSSEGDIQ